MFPYIIQQLTLVIMLYITMLSLLSCNWNCVPLEHIKWFFINKKVEVFKWGKQWEDLSEYKDILILLWSSDLLSTKYLWFPARILIQLACQHHLLNTLSANHTAIDTGTLPIPCGSFSKKSYLPLGEVQWLQSLILYRF